MTDQYPQADEPAVLACRPEDRVVPNPKMDRVLLICLILLGMSNAFMVWWNGSLRNSNTQLQAQVKELELKAEAAK